MNAVCGRALSWPSVQTCHRGTAWRGGQKSAGWRRFCCVLPSVGARQRGDTGQRERLPPLKGSDRVWATKMVKRGRRNVEPTQAAVCCKSYYRKHTQDGIKRSKMWPFLFKKYTRSDDHRQRFRTAGFCLGFYQKSNHSAMKYETNPVILCLMPSSDPPRKPEKDTRGLKERIVSRMTIVYCEILELMKPFGKPGCQVWRSSWWIIKEAACPSRPEAVVTLPVFGRQRMMSLPVLGWCVWVWTGPIHSCSRF